MLPTGGQLFNSDNSFHVYYITYEIVAIKAQETFIAAQANDEKKYRSIHERLKNIKITGEDTAAKVQLMNEILKAISSGTFFSTNLSISNNNILVDGSTFSIFALTDFLNGLKAFPSVAGISIDEINTADEGVRFKTRIEVKQTAPDIKQTKK